MEEESIDLSRKESPFNPICKCFLEPAISEEGIKISFRKEQVLNTVVRTETYLRERRIPELIRFLLTKLISQAPSKPIAFLEKLIDECMLFRAGHGSAPVLYESRHLEAVIKSFDPCQRGWLSTGQVRRLYTTLGLVPEEFLEERVPVDIIFKSVKSCQEKELYDLLVAGTNSDNNSDYLKSDEVCISNKVPLEDYFLFIFLAFWLESALIQILILTDFKTRFVHYITFNVYLDYQRTSTA